MELHYPYLRLIEEGATVEVVAAAKDAIVGKHGLQVTPDKTFDEARAQYYDGVILPGGWAPDRLRRDPKAVAFVREIDQRKKLVAAICHGPHILISAGIIKGKRATCFVAIKDDVMNAGADYVDEEVVRDRNLITSRTPRDLPAFCREIINYFK